MTTPIAGHLLHLFTNDMEPLRIWHVKTFGCIAQTRRGFLTVFDAGETAGR